jgi:hypothetical protein
MEFGPQNSININVEALLFPQGKKPEAFPSKKRMM